MSDPQSNEVIAVHLTYLREQMDEVVAHLRAQNGKLETHGQKLAQHDTDLALLRDRGSDARSSGAKWGAGAGAFITGAALALWQFFSGR